MIFTDCTFNDRLKLYIDVIFPKESKQILAEQMGITQSQLSNYTCGKTQPGTDKLEKFQFLGVSFNWLINGEGSIFSLEESGIAIKKQFLDDFYHSKNKIEEQSYTNNMLIEKLTEIFGEPNNLYEFLDIKEIIYNKEDFDVFFAGNEKINMRIEKIFYQLHLGLFFHCVNCKQRFYTTNYFIDNIKKYDKLLSEPNTKELQTAIIQIEEILQRIKK